MNKIQITLTPQETAVLSLQGQTLGYDVTKFIKFLVSQTVYRFAINIPTYKMSKTLEKDAIRALDDYNTGKLRSYNSVDEMFVDL